MPTPEYREQRNSLSPIEKIRITTEAMRLARSLVPKLPGQPSDLTIELLKLILPISTTLIIRAISPNGASYEIDFELRPPDIGPGEMIDPF
jgi:hypothetical protein